MTEAIDTSKAVSVRIYTPDERLRGDVTFYYFVDAPRAFQDFLYPEWGNVRLGISGDWHVRMGDRYPTTPLDSLYGPTDRCAEVVAGPGTMVGFGVTPIGWRRLIGGDASAMANRVCALGNTLGVEGSDLRAAFAADSDDSEGVARWNALLVARLARRPAVDPIVMAIDQALRTQPANVGAFALALGLPPRTLHRQCLHAFGFPPKRLLRRQRFLDTLGAVRLAVRNPVEPSLGLQYYDLPQFYRDFRDFMGMSARAYFSSERVLMGPAAEAQRAASVPLSFALPSAPAIGQ